MNNNNINSVKRYHDVLYYAHVTDKKKMNITSIIALLVTSNYKKFSSEYESLLLNQEQKASEILVSLGEEYLKTLKLDSDFANKVLTGWSEIRGMTALNNLEKDNQHINIILIIKSFIEDCLPNIKNNDSKTTIDFIGLLFAELNGRGSNGKTGIVLTPFFLADFMTELLDLDYKVDSVFDGACGSGAFIVAAFSKMYAKMQADFDAGKITADERNQYTVRLSKSFFGNDLNEEMAILALTNFALLGINIKNITNKDFFDIGGDYFIKHSINKGILNPPFEYEPSKFADHMCKNIYGVKTSGSKRLVIVCPPQAMGKKHQILSSILNTATLKAVIEIQPNAFIESNVNVSTSVFVFDIGTPHKKTDDIVYYDFTNSGFEYYKDSGLVDKFEKFETNKNTAIDTIKNPKEIRERTSTRDILSFFKIDESQNFIAHIDPKEIAKKNVEETDLTKANQEMKIILSEKQSIVDSYNNKIPNSQEFEDYLVDILSEVGE